MKLKPLNDFPGLSEPRQQMGATQLGEFELFDAAYHITYPEREALNNGQFELTVEQLRVLKDRTLAFKNTRLWMTWADEPYFHLATCEHVQKQRLNKQTFRAGVHRPETSLKVCVHCLQWLKFDGLDARRGRRLDMEQVQDDFSLKSFQDEYPFYPIL